MVKHWSKVEYLAETVKNKNIVIKGEHSYYSNAWTENFEDYVVRYLYGDEHSLANWQPQWEIDKLYIGDYVCIGAETIILMGGNNTHRMDWFSNYPFLDKIVEEYQTKGDTIIADGVWIGMRSIILPGVKIGEGVVIATGSVVTKDVAPYAIVGGNPAKEIRKRFDDETIQKLLDCKIYELPKKQFEKMRNLICDDNIDALQKVISNLI